MSGKETKKKDKEKDLGGESVRISTKKESEYRPDEVDMIAIITEYAGNPVRTK